MRAAAAAYLSDTHGVRRHLSAKEILSEVYQRAARAELKSPRATEALIDALASANEAVVRAAHACLVALTGEELPPSRKAWMDWLAGVS